MRVPRVAISTTVSLVACGLIPAKIGNAQSLTPQQQANPIHPDEASQLDLIPATPAPDTATQKTSQLTQTLLSRETPYILPSEAQPKVVYDGNFLRIRDRDRIPSPSTPLHTQQPSSAESPASLLKSEPIVRTVDIRFVNDKGEAVDKDGNPIQGRLSREFITRELKLKPGDVLKQEVIQADLQQLQQLGLFEWANVTVTPTDNGVDVVYNVQERQARSTDFGGGYNDDVGVYGTFGYQDFTLLPNPQRVEGNAQISLKNIDFNAQFVSPYQVAGDSLGYSFGVFRKRTTSNIFNRDIDLPNGQRLRDRRFGATAALTRPIGQWWGTAGLNFTRISTRDANGNIFREDVQGNPLTFSGKGIDDLYTVSFGVTRDWRDNPFHPTRGAILSLSTEQSIPIGVGNILQNRLLGNYIQYIPVRWFSTDEQNAKRYAFPEMFAVNVQAGTVIGDMPPTQAFMLGGINSVRGYEEGDLGSARSYFLASGEYRFPVVSRVGGVIFADFASDLGSGGSVPGKPAVVRNKPGIGFGTGVGARWRSPFGILRVDVGVNDQGEVRFYTEFGTGDRF